jgi:hypothetical protein
VYGDGGVHLGGRLFRPFDDPRKKGIAVIRQVQGKMVINGGIGFTLGSYVEITDQVKGTEEGSQGENAETDYACPEEIFHGKEYSSFLEKGKMVLKRRRYTGTKKLTGFRVFRLQLP